MANTPFIGTSGIAIGNGEGGYIALSIKEMTLKNLQQSLATFMAARSPFSGDLKGNGSIQYRIPYFGQTQAYEVGQVVNKVPQVGNISCSIGKYRTQFYELEDFDISMVKPEESAIVFGQIASNLSTTIMADQNAHFFLANKEHFEANPSQTIYLPELTKFKLSTEEREDLYKRVLWTHAEMTKIVSHKYIGVRGDEFYGIIDRFAQINLNTFVYRANLSEKAFDLIKYGSGGDTLDKYEIGGIGFLCDNFVNKSIPEGFSFNGDYAYDMSNYLGLMIHNDFLAFPMGLQKITSVINQNNGNTRFIAKYCFGSKVLRPELGRAFVKNLLVFANSTSVKVGEKLQINSNATEERTIAWTSSDVTKATIDTNGLVTGVAVGSVTIKAKVGNDEASINVSIIAATK